MTKSEKIKLFEELIEKKAILLSPFGCHWDIEMQFADGNACVIFKLASHEDEESEFIHFIDVDKMDISENNEIVMNVTD